MYFSLSRFPFRMSLPGVGVFSGENTTLLVQELRKAGFPVNALWSAGRKNAAELKQKLKVQCATTCIRELVLRTDVDLVMIDSPPPTHVQDRDERILDFDWLKKQVAFDKIDV